MRIISHSLWKKALRSWIFIFLLFTALWLWAEDVARPGWLKGCERNVEDCAVYLVNPFVLEPTPIEGFENSYFMYWRHLSGYTYTKPEALKKTPKKTISLPMIDNEFAALAASHIDLKVRGEAILPVGAIAPRKAFRRVTGCWPFERMTLQAVNGDDSFSFYMLENGDVVNSSEMDSCEVYLSKSKIKHPPSFCAESQRGSHIYHIYSYGDSLFHLRLDRTGPLSDEEIGNEERFFIITDEGEGRMIESVSAGNYTENVKSRAFPKRTCDHIETDPPEWRDWDDLSGQKINYPPFSSAVKSWYRK